MRPTLAGMTVVAATFWFQAQTLPARPGISLADLTWPEAERVLDPSAVVVIPLGAGSLEHGPHLPLSNDERLARYLADRVERAASVVTAPPLTYHYYPSFVDYPGSTGLTLATARDMTAEVIRSLARSGPHRFYVLNTSVSSVRALDAAAQLVADDGIAMKYTDLDASLAPTVRRIQQQPGGTHADEIETSMMLYIDRSSVDMSKAVREYEPGSSERFTRQRTGPGVHSPSGVYGDATLATPEKGRVLVEALVASVLDDIAALRAAPLPAVRSTPGAALAAAAGATGRPVPIITPSGCTPGDERTIRNIGPMFTTAWNNLDSDGISLMFTRMGDMRHPDGTIERGREIIRENRRELFTHREYRGSTHPLTFTDIRCVGSDVAIVDGKWELRMIDAKGGTVPFRGLCTLVLRRSGPMSVGVGASEWLIEAWRYTVSPPDMPGPTILKRPGWGGGQ